MAGQHLWEGFSLGFPSLNISSVDSRGGRAEPSASHVQGPGPAAGLPSVPSPLGPDRLQPIRIQGQGSGGKQEEREGGGSS